MQNQNKETIQKRISRSKNYIRSNIPQIEIKLW